VDGHLDCFLFGASMSNAAMNIYVLMFCGHIFSFLLSEYLEMELFGQILSLFLTFFFFYSAGDQTQSCASTKQVLYH
jgi:hypothetical protein